MPDKASYEEDLHTTFDFFANNSTERLSVKAKEKYLRFPPEQRGGDLFLRIMLELLQVNNCEAVHYLIKLVKGIKISEIEGENVSTAVSTIWAAVDRLKSIIDPATNRDSLPDDFEDTIIQVL